MDFQFLSFLLKAHVSFIVAGVSQYPLTLPDGIWLSPMLP